MKPAPKKLQHIDLHVKQNRTYPRWKSKTRISHGSKSLFFIVFLPKKKRSEVRPDFRGKKTRPPVASWQSWWDRWWWKKREVQSANLKTGFLPWRLIYLQMTSLLLANLITSTIASKSVEKSASWRNWKWVRVRIVGLVLFRVGLVGFVEVLSLTWQWLVLSWYWYV